MSSSSSREKSSPSRDLSSNPNELGEALAGMSLHSQASFGGSSALATAIAQGTSTNHESASSDGWGNYKEPASSTTGTKAAAKNVFSGSTGVGANPGANHASNESLERFLSLDPSHTLGEDVFKLSHHNLPSLNYEESKNDAAGAFRVQHPSSLAPGPANTRRRSDSPSGTGTAASSRSGSPYNNSVDINSAGRMIQAYQPYESTSSGGGEPVSRNQSMLGDDDRSSSGYNSLAHAHGSHPSLTTLDSKSPYGKDRTYNSTGGFDRSLDPPQTAQPQLQQQQQSQQPHVLFMAVPSPDGRGQVLQPVQMVQLPGKPYTYVVPDSNGAAAAPQNGFFPEQSANGMMTLPTVAPPGGAGTDFATPDLRGDNLTIRSNNYVDPLTGRSSVDDFNRNAVLPTNGSFQPAVASDLTYAATPQRPPLETLLGQIRRLSRDQVGCRLVQQALDEEGPTAATLILNEGLSFWGEAMVDPFGNYLFQKILEKVTAEERVMLVKNVSTRLVNASLNLHGTRSVQKVVELCAQDEQSGATKGMEETAATILTTALTPAAARLCIDSHGNHVIQRILLKLGPEHSKFVFDAVAASVGDVARHRHGCCVIQRCLDSQPNEARSHLVSRIVEKSLELMQDAYGNYVVQYVLDVCSDEDVHAVCESVVGKVNLLAIQKFSSNVMEKCLERCSDRVKEMYLTEMSDPERIRELMMDPFGNYVVQRALSVATHAQAIRLVEAMRPHLIATQTGNGQRNGGVRNTAGGRRIIAKICRRFPNFTLNPVGTQEELYSQNKGNRHHHVNNHRHHSPHHHQQQQHHHHPQIHQTSPPPQQPAIMQPYAAVGGPTNGHHHYDPRLAPGHISMQQPPPPAQQQQAFYGIGGGAGYYDQFSNPHSGGYSGM